MLAQRIGEAKNPGPVSSLIAQTQQTILDAFSQSSAGRRSPQATTPAATQLDSPQDTVCDDEQSSCLPDNFAVQLLHQSDTFPL
eukprot:4631461-Amphidinium_carterae.1